ncbi:MAG: RagB/SusD family nutrient uptake outer membrane protein [Bacteroidales bacterium]|nr:RagB/SusD family nutrient uptake outer membrane protein [Bacteroidales bacterium]MDD3990136.1 RagB/SusD family nutrient uptake outer membrane protein [Bacteroidales bacterium]
MKKIYQIVLFCCTVFFPAACEELVEVDYPTNQIATKQVFEDLSTANSALDAIYAGLRDQSVIAGGQYYGLSALLGSYTDELEYYISTQDLIDIYQNQQQRTNTFIKSIWNKAYTQIYYANSIIQGVEQSTTISNDDKNSIKGEALFIRSLIYFYLSEVFDDIPYTVSLDYEYNRFIGKTEVTELLEQLELDLQEAVSLLNDDYRNSERIYPNRKVAELLLAKVYLTEQKYPEAEQIAENILDSPLYQFQTDINEVFKKSGQHIIWQLKPNSGGNFEASFYFSNAAPKSYALTQDLVNSFDNNDLRKQVWMSTVTYNGNMWYRPDKYKDRTTSPVEYPVVFRLEEVYLILAEALAKQNRINEALPYLNATRLRAGLTAFTTSSGDGFVNELLAERRREFFTELAHRFLDLKRLGRLNDLSAVKTNWEGYNQVWPLPESELLLNPNLYPQNTGY